MEEKVFRNLSISIKYSYFCVRDDISWVKVQKYSKFMSVDFLKFCLYIFLKNPYLTIEVKFSL